MKLSMSERRKLNNRLPLWESAYKSGNAAEKSELIIKIEDARKKLGIPKFLKEEEKVIYQPKEKTINKINLKIKLTQEKYGNQYFKSRNITTDESINLAKLMVQWHNEDGLNDSEISVKIERSRYWIVGFKKKFIDVEYAVVDYKRKIHIDKYLELKRQNKKIKFICEYFGIAYCELKSWESKNVTISLKLSDDYKKYSKKYVDFMESIIDRLNAGEEFRTLCREKGIWSCHAYKMKRQMIETVVNPLPVLMLDPILYVEYKEKDLSDLEISKIHGISQATITYMKNKHIKIIYKLKNF